MTMLLLTVVGLVIAGWLTGAFPAANAAMHRRQKGQSMVERRPAPWRPAPRMQPTRQRYGTRH
jgi:hypothetical protein